MVRRGSKSYREDEILLSHEDPRLSDSLPLTTQGYPSSGDNRTKSAKNGGWKSRLFGGGGGNTHAPGGSTAIQNQQAISYPHHQSASVAGRSRSAPQQHPTQNGSAGTSRYSHQATAAVNYHPQHRPRSYLPEGTTKTTTMAIPDLANASSSSSSQNNGSSHENEGLYRIPVLEMTKIQYQPSLTIETKLSSHSASSTRPERQTHSVAAPGIAAAQPPTGAIQSSGPSHHMASTQPRAMHMPDPRVLQTLKRPFGRETVRPVDLPWMVAVLPAEWDGDDSLWKHRVNIQRMIQSGQEEIMEDLTHGITLRSILDFWWLERALRSEFHGALLIPSLSIALGVPDLQNCQVEVDSQLLTNWLSDVLNGIRGQGEWYRGQLAPVNWRTSEAMEAFMYRADLCTVEDEMLEGSNSAKREDGHVGILQWITQGNVCGVPGCAVEPDSQPYVLSPSTNNGKIHLPLSKQTVSSKALGDARTLHVQDSFVDPSPHLENLARRTPAQYTELLQAERELIWNWRTRALSVMEKLRILQDEERNVAAGWKRFAIALCNLFSYEKEVESAKFGEIKSRKDFQMPFRKLQKSTVDDILRIMAKQEMDRFALGLEQLSSMIAAYLADLSSVQPAMDAYFDGLQQLSMQSEMVERLILGDHVPDARLSSSSFQDQIQAGLYQVKKQLVALGDGSTVEVSQAKAQLESMGWRVKENEELFQENLTSLCKSSPVRGARMAYQYLLTESKQAGALHGSAVNARTKLNVASMDALSKMIQRHDIESKEDQEKEMELVQRIVKLGNSRKFSKDGTEERGVEFMNRKAEVREKAIELCRGRIGRWDAKVAMAIMEAVGVEDANVRVEETTRELRLVRKHAIGLREHVERCTEALGSLQSHVRGGIAKLRREMILELQTLLSGAYQPIEAPSSALNIQALFDKGIPCNDPLGWRRQRGGCGGAFSSYLDERDSNMDWLLNSLTDLVQEYYYRVESIESFVYMECVGIQLEKHLSQRRASALAAFEKKTDITSAINTATRKRRPDMVQELQTKLKAVGAEVSHTTVKESKEAHLESKFVKYELHELSMRQLTRTRESSTEQVIAVMSFWCKAVESSSSKDVHRLKELIQTIERSLGVIEQGPCLQSHRETVRSGSF